MFKRQKISLKIKYPDSILCDSVFYNLTVNNRYGIAICSTMNTYTARCCLTSNFSVLLHHVAVGSYLGCCTPVMLGRCCALKGFQQAAVQGESSWDSPPQGGDRKRWLTGTYGRAGEAQCCPRMQAKLTVATQKSRCPYPCGQIRIRVAVGYLNKGVGGGQVLGVIWRCWYGFPTVAKGVSGLGGERAWKEYTGTEGVLKILGMCESGKGQKERLHMVGRNQGLGGIWKSWKSSRVAMCFLSLFLSPGSSF